MKAFRISTLSLFLLTVLFITGCKDDPTSPPVEAEHAPATTVTLYLIQLNTDGSETTDTSRATVRDTSVVKGKPFSEGVLQLTGGKSYKGTFRLWDESKSPSEELTHEIVNEQNSHLFVFTLKNDLNAKLTISDLNKDGNNKPFGLVFKVTTNAGTSGNGLLNVKLHHHDSGNKDDNAYDTDMDRDFPVSIL